MADPLFAHPRLAAIYDDLEGDRHDLDAYAAMVDEFGAQSVLDIGCGTGTLAHRLAPRGIDVVGVDPAGTSLDVARGKAGAGLITWIEGDATALPPLEVDLAFMTGNVAQVFLTDEDWAATLRAARRALRPGGRLVFETRVVARRAWLGWIRDRTWRRLELDGVTVETWADLSGVDLPFVSFRSVFVFEHGDAVVSDSTLRFRDRAEIEAALADAGFAVDDVRDAPDRPGLEMVFVARTTGA